MPLEPAAPSLVRSSSRQLDRLAVTGIVSCGVGAAMPACYLLWSFLDPARFNKIVHLYLPDLTFTLTPTAWRWAVAIFLFRYSLWAWQMWQGSVLFRLVLKGERFGPAMEQALKALALGGIVRAAFNILSKAALVAVITWPTFPQLKMLPFAWPHQELVVLLVAILLFLFAGIIAEGRRIDEENRGFV